MGVHREAVDDWSAHDLFHLDPDLPDLNPVVPVEHAQFVDHRPRRPHLAAGMSWHAVLLPRLALSVEVDCLDVVDLPGEDDSLTGLDTGAIGTELDAR
jgi:hypothetical protein